MLTTEDTEIHRGLEDHLFPKVRFMRLTYTLSVVALLCPAVVSAADWTIPVAGNIYQTSPAPGRTNPWTSTDVVHSVYVHVDRAATLELSIEAGTDGTSEIETRVGEQKFAVQIRQSTEQISVGSVKVTEPGYVRVDFQGVKKSGRSFGRIEEVLIKSDTPDLKLTYVRDNNGGMFYWGRRGPSVHLSYSVPRNVDLTYAYSEVTVPKGQDPIGTFYMANGFGQGYFGMQVNSAQQRRVLFSVWSPFRTDNPKDIPKDQRIESLARGPEVHIGEFGNEGSGGQSYLVYPWKAGRTYRFLTKVVPDGEGSTRYTCWFGDKAADEWRLIASFRRPKTDTHLKGFHSFLESFSPAHGYIGRRASYSNVWVCDVNANWHQCVDARFSVDGTGGNRHRIDFSGGADGTDFFLRNCGFFTGNVKAGTRFTRESTADQQPEIDFDQLPKK